MSIKIQDQLITLTTDSSQYQMKVDDYGILSHLWYGPITDEDMSYLYHYPDVGFSGNIYDAETDTSYSLDTRMVEYPVWGTGDYRITAASIQEPNGASVLDLRYEGYEIMDGTVKLEGLPHLRPTDQAKTLKVIMKDVTGNIQVNLFYTVLEKENIIARWAEFINLGKDELVLKAAASASLDVPEEDLELIHLYGRHNRERKFERTPIMHGIHEVSSLRGTSSHQHNPAVILAKPDTTEDYGLCWGMMMVYSGSYSIQIEKDQMHQVRVVMGLNPQLFSWNLKPGESFVTPQALFSMSDTGFASLSHNFHNVINHHIIEPQFQNRPRDILINNWEATYFNFTGEKILDIARKASKLGIELMVLDDGWFGQRNHDQEGLGDWFVNEEKLGMPLNKLIDQIHDMGMKFGIWIEPEMISENSELYRKHPQWALSIPGHKPIRSRNQLVLDYANPEVVEYMYKQFSKLLRENDIAYVKWDMNRSITDWYTPTLPADRQKEAPHRYVLGLYSLIGRLRQEFPDILFEGCSGGGGRFDAGMLYYTPQIWTSDDTDAHERTIIQHGTSFFYPVSTMGSHVSAVPNHQTGREVSLDARGVSAMHGSFGYELDLNTLSESEQEIVKEQCKWYRRLQDLIYHGQYYRLSDPNQERRALWEFVSQDQKQVLVQGLIFAIRPNALPEKVRLKGLDPNARYKLVMENFGYDHDVMEFSGKALMEAGTLLPSTWGTDAPVTLLFEKAD